MSILGREAVADKLQVDTFIADQAGTCREPGVQRIPPALGLCNSCDSRPMVAEDPRGYLQRMCSRDRHRDTPNRRNQWQPMIGCAMNADS